MAGMTIPVFLITAGVLFLLMEFHAISIQWTWPVLPLVIVAVKLLQHRSPEKEHVPAGYGFAPLPRNEMQPQAGPSGSPARRGGSTSRNA
jgi:hypothetical protein